MANTILHPENYETESRNTNEREMLRELAEGRLGEYWANYAHFLDITLREIARFPSQNKREIWLNRQVQDLSRLASQIWNNHLEKGTPTSEPIFQAAMAFLTAGICKVRRAADTARGPDRHFSLSPGLGESRW